MLNDNFLFHCRNLSQYLKKISIRKVSITKRHTPNTKKNQMSVVESLISLVFDAFCTCFFINEITNSKTPWKNLFLNTILMFIKIVYLK